MFKRLRRKLGLSPLRYAVLLIDMQDYFLQHHHRDDQKMLLSAHERVLDLCHDKSLPVAVLEYANHGSTTDYLREKVECLPQRETFTKSSDSAFVGTTLHHYLCSLDISDVVLLGINAEVCVKCTAIDAKREGYSLLTARDCIAQPRAYLPGESTDRIPLSKWYEKNTQLYENSSVLIEMIKCSFHRDGLVERL